MFGSYVAILRGFAHRLRCPVSLAVSKTFSLQLKHACGPAHNVQAFLTIHIEEKAEGVIEGRVNLLTD